MAKLARITNETGEPKAPRRSSLWRGEPSLQIQGNSVEALIGKGAVRVLFANQFCNTHLPLSSFTTTAER